MRESGVPMMHSMIRLVEKGESNKSPEPPVRNNAPSGTVYRRASKPHMLDIFTQALHVGSQKRRCQIEPKEIVPQVPQCDCGQDADPHHRAQSELSANAPTHALLRIEEPVRKNARVNRKEMYSSWH